jgi:acetylornithine deacetylase/succinyl-diaminopimelate desuccinylase-like protein
VVFPDTDPLPLTVEADRICCPGIGDDSANVAALLMAAKYLAETGLQPKDTGVVLVINAGEEGLGNLKGSRKIMERYGARVKEFISLDGCYLSGADAAVGSHRYRIAIDTEGGHSYGAFGNRNAIAYLASLIDTLYTMKVPPMGRTTYNVGTISGGTSVNTIAQHAEMLYEYRSDDRRSLELMRQHLAAAIKFYRAKGVQVTVELVGDRPCGGDVPADAQAALNARVTAAVKARYGTEPSFIPSSTDCNIPLSLGVPAVCIGCYEGHGAHTREEYLLTKSLHPGRKLALELLLAHF